MSRGLAVGLLVVTLGTACAGGAAGGGGAWQEAARAAQLLGPTQASDAAAAVSALPAAERQAVSERLDALAALQPGVDGIRQAGALVREGVAALAGGPTQPGGSSAAQGALLRGATVVLHGLVYRSGQAVAAGPDPEAAAALLLAAVRQDLAVFPGAPGQSTTPPELERELRLGLGPELYVKVVKQAG